jgi:EAL domain-containing protein (putative c-di-GMP-specific phosphodiesterase class I)
MYYQWVFRTSFKAPHGLPEQRGIRSLYQPLVDLYGGETVAYEALARGPVGSGLESPDVLFKAAEEAGLEAETDWECQRAAVSGALDVGLSPGQALFINIEPRLLTVERPQWLVHLVEAARGRFSIFVEFTERDLTDRPAELLAAIERMRRLGVGVVLERSGALVLAEGIETETHRQSALALGPRYL